ncbi:uncharacterized [Tachysurus ichikawai]
MDARVTDGDRLNADRNQTPVESPVTSEVQSRSSNKGRRQLSMERNNRRSEEGEAGGSPASAFIRGHNRAPN